MPRSPRLVAALLAVAAVALSGATPVAGQAPDTDPGLAQTIEEDQATATGPADLDLGHVDMGPRFVDGEWTLMIHDDTVEPSVWRSLDDAVLQVRDTALLPVPDDPNYAFLDIEPGTEVHVVPQTQAPDVVWLGWNTQDPEVLAEVGRGVTMSLLGVDGPGTVTMYLQAGNLEPPDVLWSSTVAEAQPVWVEVNTHTHANWVFSEPGVYLLEVEVSADLISGETVSDTRTVRVAVGDGTSTDEARAATYEGEVAAPPTEAEHDRAAGEPAAAAAAPDDEGAGWALVVVGIGAAVVLVVAVAVVVLRGASAKRRAEAERYDGLRAPEPGA